jgi:hypothetical protein
MNYILWVDGAEHGPYDTETLQNFVQTGDVLPKTLARLESETEWKALDSFLPKQSAENASIPVSATTQNTPKIAALAVIGILVVGVVAWVASMGMKSKSAVPKEGDLRGTVFIATRSAETFKLSLVPVVLIPEAAIRSHLEARQADVAERRKEFIALRNKLRDETEAATGHLNASRAMARKIRATSEAALESARYVQKSLPRREGVERSFADSDEQKSRLYRGGADPREIHDLFDGIDATRKKAFDLLEKQEQHELAGLSQEARGYLQGQELNQAFVRIQFEYAAKLMKSQQEADAEVSKSERLVANCTKAQASATPWNEVHAACLMSELPNGIASSRTDADGRFSLKIPATGRFALVAAAKRAVGEKEEHYYWMIWASLDGQLHREIALTNENLLQVDNPDSVATTSTR